MKTLMMKTLTKMRIRVSSADSAEDAAIRVRSLRAIKRSPRAVNEGEEFNLGDSCQVR